MRVNTFSQQLISSLAVFVVLIVPSLVDAQSSFVTCSGTDCSTCNLVDLGNELIKWLFGIVFLLFAGLMAIAGFGLVTSGGNQSALEAAKSKFTNAIIGLLIMMSAWLIVDTIMKGLLKGGTGEITGWGPWSEVKCLTQAAAPRLTDLENERENPPPPDPALPPAPPANPAGMSDLSDMGLQVANWQGTNGPGRTDKANPAAAAAAKQMFDAGKAKYGKVPFQITAAYTEGVGHSANSQHYKGTAIDFQPINGISKEQVAQLARDAGFKFVLIEARHVHADMR